MFILKPRIQKCDQSIMELCKDVCPSTIGHMQDHGFIRNLKVLKKGVKIVRNAVTVRIPHLDSTAVHKVLMWSKKVILLLLILIKITKEHLLGN